MVPDGSHHHQNQVLGVRGANNEGQAINLLGSCSVGYHPDFGTGRNVLSKINKTPQQKSLSTLQLRTSIHQKIY